MAAGLGKAFIEIHADTRPFNKELAALISGAVKAAEKAIRPQAKKLGEEIGDSVSDGVAGQMPKVGKKIQDEVDKIKPKITPEIDIDQNRNLFSRNLRNLFAKDGGIVNLFKSLWSGATKAGDAVKTLVANIFNVPANSPLAAILTLLVITILPAFIGLVITASAVLADLLGFIAVVPGVLASILAVVGPLIIGFQGLGKAIEVAFTEDPEEFAEALEGLSPVTANLARMLRGFKPIFEDIAQLTEEAFLRPLLGLQPAMRRLLPVVMVGFMRLGRTLGNFFGQIGTFLGSPVFLNFLEKLFPAVEQMISTLAPATTSLLEGLTRVAEASLPTIQLLVEMLAGFLERFAAFIQESIENGSFQEFLDEAMSSFQILGELAGALLDLLLVIFEETDEEGRTLLGIFTQIIEDLTEFFESEQGQAFLNDLAETALLFSENFRLVLPFAIAAFQIFSWIAKQLNTAVQFASTLLGLVRKIKGESGQIGGGLGSAAGRLAGVGASAFAEGGIVREPTLALIGEAGDEAVIPLSDPRRAAEVMAQAGLGMGAPVVYVFIGNEQLDSRMFRIASQQSDAEAMALSNGPRGN